MKLLILGVGDAIFRAKDGNTSDRLQQYLALMKERESDSRILNLVYATANHTPIIYPDLEIMPAPAPRAPLFPWAGWRLLRKRGDIPQFDLITAQNPFEAGFLAWRLAREYNIPFELQIHFNFFSPYWLKEHPVVNRARRALARFLLTRADLIRVVSSPIASALHGEWGIKPEKTHITPVPVFFFSEEERVERPLPPLAHIPPDAPLLFFAGRFCYQKNLPGLVQLIRQLLLQRPEVHIVLGGSGPMQSFMAQEVARLATANVHLVGNIPYHEMPGYYQRADIVLLPSLYEGFGRVLLEGYLFKTPAVATRSGGPEDIILDGETGFLTPVEDMTQFGQQVNWLLERPDIRRQMGQRGHDYVKRKFAPATIMQQIVDHWFDAAGRRR